MSFCGRRKTLEKSSGCSFGQRTGVWLHRNCSSCPVRPFNFTAVDKVSGIVGSGLRLGERLTRIIARDAERFGYKTLVLDSLERLGPAVRLYEHLGFRRRERYIANPEEDAVFMEIDLPLA